MDDLFKALADRTRRKILDELAGRDGQTLFELVQRLLMLHGISSTRQAISQHLDILENANLITVKRDGRYKFHYINTAALDAVQNRLAYRYKRGIMRIYITSVPIADYDKALAFYTEVLGFVKKKDIELGKGIRFITVVSPEDPDGTELLLEPNADHPGIKALREALAEDGIPITSFAVDDVQKEYERLEKLGVKFTQKPMSAGGWTTAVFDDTNGNLIEIAEIKEDD